MFAQTAVKMHGDACAINKVRSNIYEVIGRQYAEKLCEQLVSKTLRKTPKNKNKKCPRCYLQDMWA